MTEKEGGVIFDFQNIKTALDNSRQKRIWKIMEEMDVVKSVYNNGYVKVKLNEKMS